MQYLLRNKISIAILCVCLSSAAMAQRDEVFRPNQDQLPYFFGISVGISNYYASYQLDGKFLPTNASLQDAKSAIQISPINNTFFNLGLSATKKLTNHIYLRANPNFLIGGNKSVRFNLNATKDSSQRYRIPSSIIQIPVAFKIQSDRYNGFRRPDFMRHYLLIGGKVDFDLTGENKSGIIKPEGVFNKETYTNLFKKIDLGAEIGVGMSFYLRYVTISPELKFSYGLQNSKKNDVLLSNIDKINSNFAFFTVHLEN
jgi:Outer membrane protein beta-barrel domain